MKICLATARFKNKDIAHNTAQIEKYMRIAKREHADLVCFGEAFLQGFDAMNWEFAHDREIAVEIDSPVMQRLCRFTKEIGIDLLLGFLERDGDRLYSSCALFSDNKLIHIYRRISRGWKEYRKTDWHYCEGEAPEAFLYKGRRCVIALCGDLFDFPERFAKGEELLFWPVFVNYPMEDWQSGVCSEYAAQANKVCSCTLLFDSLCDEENVFGGCCHFVDGKTVGALETGEEGILLVER